MRLRLLVGLSGLALLDLLGVASTAAQTPPVTTASPVLPHAVIARARQAYDGGRFAEAARLFAQADEAIGGYPYGENEYDDGELVRPTAEARAARDGYQCPWALATLATSPAPDSDARRDALARARSSCDAPGRATAALLAGDVRQAALVLGPASALPPPFAARAVPPDARAWASAVTRGAFPAARDAEEALAFVRAHAAAEHGLETRCGALRGLAVTAAGERWPLPDEDAELDIDHAAPPFATGTPDPLAFVECAYEPAVSPYEEPSMGPGADVEVYALTRDAGGVRVIGHFRGFPRPECWTGVIQGLRAHRAIAFPGGGHLYAIERTEGYSSFDEPAETYIVDEVVLCDPRRAACRTVPVGLEQQTVDWEVDPPRTHTFEWTSGYAVRGDRLVLTRATRAPRALRRFGAGVPLDDLFAAPPLETTPEALFGPAPETTPAPAPATTSDAASRCPWQVADADGQTNVRGAPGTGQPAIGTLANGTPVDVVERRGRWWRIETPRAGWVWSSNLRQVCP